MEQDQTINFRSAIDWHTSPVPLPVAAEINGGSVSEREPGHAVDLFPIGQSAVIFPPSGLLCEAQQIWASDVMVMPNLGTPHAGKELFRPIGAGAVETVSLFMIDPLHFIARV